MPDPNDDTPLEAVNPAKLEKKIRRQSWFEHCFEKSLWNCRFVVLLAVIFGLISAIALFVLGAVEVVSGIKYFYEGSTKPPVEIAAAAATITTSDSSEAVPVEIAPAVKSKKVERGPKLVGTLIGAVDYFLIGVVLLIFSFGIYELFISHLEVGRLNDEVKILEITNLDDLKNRIIKVVIMVLIVSFFKKILSIEFETPQDMFFFASSIFVLCLGVYFMHKEH